MGKSPTYTQGLCQFLDESGVLEHGTDEEICAVRRAHRKLYLKNYKEEQRKDKPEFLVQLSKQDGTFTKISTAAKKHRMSVTAFLRLATLAYIERSFLVPDRIMVAKLSSLLESCLNDVRSMASMKGKYSVFQLEEKYDAIEARIVRLETEIQSLFLVPPLLEAAVADAVRNDPALRDRLLILLSHAHRED